MRQLATRKVPKAMYFTRVDEECIDETIYLIGSYSYLVCHIGRKLHLVAANVACLHQFCFPNLGIIDGISKTILPIPSDSKLPVLIN